MKLCWEALDNLVLIPKHGSGIDVLKYYDDPIELEGYRGIFDISDKPCKYCGKYYLKPESGIQEFCDKDCRIYYFKENKKPKYTKVKIDKRKKENGGGWHSKGNSFGSKNRLSKTNTVSYNTHKDKLDWFVETRPDPDDARTLQVRCCLCNTWFTPSKGDVRTVLKAIKHEVKNPNFYCSSNCKSKCPYFGKRVDYMLLEKKYSEIHKIPKSILYYDWQEELCKENNKLIKQFYKDEKQRIRENKELEKQRLREQKNKEMEDYLNSEERTIEQKLRRMLGLSKQRAKKKGFDFDLTYLWLRTNLPERCPKCNLPFSFDTSIKMNPLAPSIQRINPSKGYTKDNCIITSWIYNCGLNVFTEKVLYTICKSYLNNNS